MTSIFVAKLDFGVDNDQLKSLFEAYGVVNKATIATDKETGRSRGFAFVEMANDEEAAAAINGLDNQEVNGRRIAVKEAEDRGGNQNRQRDNNRGPRQNNFQRRDNGGENKREFRPANSDRPPRNEGGAPPSFTPSTSLPDSDSVKDNRKKDKEPKKKAKDADKPKVQKMEAYKKSGKSNRFYDEDDELDEDFDLFGRDEDDDNYDDDSYSKYIVNSDDDEDWDDDEDYDDED
ncbi:MAG: RNA-binding protein [Crocinitomicaceae bacterium]|jgi:RNA recognition motif-containing protein|nr:RNA-binding protein [Crocinitomicaceae bacterium]